MSRLLRQLANTPLVSREWRLQNLYTIADADSKLVAFDPNAAQREFYNSMWYCNHVLKARKLGFSTFIEIIFLDDMLFHPDPLTTGIIDYTKEDAQEKLAMMALAYEHLDDEELHPETWEYGALIKKARPAAVSTTKIEWEHGAKATCATAFRGRTPNRLHISELGKTAIFAPIKCREIINGAFNSMTPGNVRNIESTHEGARLGEHYRLVNQAMKHDPARLTKIDSKFHFFPWWKDERYQLDPRGHTIRPEIVKYFQRLKADHGIVLEKSRMLWYDRKELEQGHGMKKEFPSTPGEAFEAISNGAIYGTEMADLRSKGRIIDFGMEKAPPIFTFWDIGLSDYISMWLIQPCGRHFLVLDWFECEGRPASDMGEVIFKMEERWGKSIAVHFLPHDCDTRSPGNGKSYTQELAEAGIKNTRKVPRIPDIWLGIGEVRKVLPHCWFNRARCDQPRKVDGSPHDGIGNDEDFPSGVACLEGYSKDVSPQSIQRLREMPKHDLCSHSADAFRTFAEAHSKGLIKWHTDDELVGKPAVTGGLQRRAHDQLAGDGKPAIRHSRNRR